MGACPFIKSRSLGFDNDPVTYLDAPTRSSRFFRKTSAASDGYRVRRDKQAKQPGARA
jgi:hypothetical protein